MTSVVGDPQAFAADAAAGFCDLYPEYVNSVSGGVIRSSVSRADKVALVVGGGAGHYPAFAGYVGVGLADGAVIGDVFASPSTSYVASVARAASNGAGVILSFGNYMGDVINFTAAATRLREEGLAVEVLAVTDDVASASSDEIEKRRGVAGGVVVFKLAGAAAEAGYDLAAVTRIAERSNARTRTLGIAFSGCTLPGSKEALFELPRGIMGVGLGIHGEPGIEERSVATAPEIAQMLVSRLIGERPPDAGNRLAVILNGLGATKAEELFVLWHYVAPLLRETGHELVAPLVGEYVTSLDMAGCSLTLTWLDDELERLWLAPAHAPAFQRGPAVETRAARTKASGAVDQTAWPDASAASRRSAACLTRVLGVVHERIAAAEDELGRLDAHAGDGDHGQAMERGLAAAHSVALDADQGNAGAASLLAAAADAWADRSGGTSGALWGVALRTMAQHFSDTEAIDDDAVVAGTQAALAAIMEAGKAKVGDKTMIDAFAPFAETLAGSIAAGASLADAWRSAAEAAARAADATAQMSPRIGRARPLAEKSIGHPDAGAMSFALCATAVGQFLLTVGPPSDLPDSSGG